MKQEEKKFKVRVVSYEVESVDRGEWDEKVLSSTSPITDWNEVTEEEFHILNKYCKQKSNYYGTRYTVIQLENINFIPKSIEEMIQIAKEEEIKNKAKEKKIQAALKKTEEARKIKALEKKKKQLEKLKAELGDVS